MTALMRQPSRQSPFQLGMVVAVLLGLLVALASSVSPELHHRMHGDVDDEHHECLATALLSGGCDVGAVVALLVVAVLPKAEVLVWPAEARGWQSFHLRCRILEHAPPFAALD